MARRRRNCHTPAMGFYPIGAAIGTGAGRLGIASHPLWWVLLIIGAFALLYGLLLLRRKGKGRFRWPL